MKMQFNFDSGNINKKKVLIALAVIVAIALCVIAGSKSEDDRINEGIAEREARVKADQARQKQETREYLFGPEKSWQDIWCGQFYEAYKELSLVDEIRGGSVHPNLTPFQSEAFLMFDIIKNKAFKEIRTLPHLEERKMDQILDDLAHNYADEFNKWATSKGFKAQ